MSRLHRDIIEAISTGGARIKTRGDWAYLEELVLGEWMHRGEIDSVLLRGDGPDGEDVVDCWGWTPDTAPGKMEWRIAFVLLDTRPEPDDE